MRTARAPLFLHLRRSITGLAALCATVTSFARTPPQLNEAPTRPPVAERRSEAAPAVAEAQVANGFVVNPSSRESARIFYRTVYAASENVPSGWTGDVASGNAGTTSAEFKEAVQRRVNYFRAMAGVPAGITFDSTYNAKDQQAALMMSANASLSHAPPSNWKFYTADGAEAAGHSNIFLGYHGPPAVTGYIEDFGSPNPSAGHRRWILYPQTKRMGTGDIPPDGIYQEANALWVATPDFGTTRPAVRDEFVAWPPPGFIPYSLVFPRWSFSYPGANFENAVVMMERGGANVAVSIENRGAGAGEETLVWAWDNRDANSVMQPGTPPASDTPVQVSVNEVVIGGQTRNFSYTVTLFDPQKPGADTVLATASGPAQPVVNASAHYTCNAVPGAVAYQFRAAKLSALTAIEGAENGTAGVTVDAPAGTAIVSSAYHAGGTKSFHFTTPDFGRQAITLKRTVLASASAQVKFKSRFGYATAAQVAHVQTSTDDGLSWDTLFTAAGTSTPDAGFSDKAVSLAAYANRTVTVRFVFQCEGDGTIFNQTDENIGWYLDDISFANTQELAVATLGPVTAGATFDFTPATAGNFAVQARAEFFGDYLFEWGPILPVTAGASAAPQITAQPASVSAALGAGVQFTVAASGTGTFSYQWFHDDQAIPGATSAMLALSDVQPSAAGAYRVKVTNALGTVTSNAATLTVLLPNPVATTSSGTAVSENSVMLSGHVEVTGQTVTCGFEYGTSASLGTTANAGSAAAATDFEATISPISANSTIYFRASAQIASGARFRGTVKTITPLRPLASLNVIAAPSEGGTVSGIPSGAVRVGDRITLVAQPASGWGFTGWSGSMTKAAPTLSFVMPASLTLIAGFSTSPILNATGRYRGLALTNPPAHASCGLVTITVATKGAFSGQAVIGGKAFTLRGTFHDAGVAHFGAGTEAALPRPGKPPLLLRLNLPAGNVTPMRILGDVREAGGFSASIDAPRAVFTALAKPAAPLRNPPPEWTGPGTADLTLSASTPVTNLNGRGWLASTIGKDGSVRFAGALPDGTRWTSSQPIAIDGTVPLFTLLYGGTGSVFGDVQLDGAPVTLTSTLTWFRPANATGVRFAAGWPGGVRLALDGGAWTPFKPNVTWPLPDLASHGGSVHLWANGGGLSAGLDWAASFAFKTGRVTIVPSPSGASATFLVTTANGVFTGSFKSSPNGVLTGFSGVLISGKNRARGFFSAPSGSGAVTLLPH